MNITKMGSKNAKTIEIGGTTYLVSYTTVVALTDKDGAAIRTLAKFSCTTTKHINNFLREYGFDPKKPGDNIISKSQNFIEDRYVDECTSANVPQELIRKAGVTVESR